MANPNVKGANFERQIANLLSDHFKSKYNTTNSFRRNIEGSGSFFGGKNTHRTKTHINVVVGDIITPENFPYVIECKAYKTAPSLQAIVKQKVGLFDKWIEQVETDAKAVNKHPLLIVKFNLVPILALTPKVTKRLTPLFRYKNYYAYILNDFLPTIKIPKDK